MPSRVSFILSALFPILALFIKNIPEFFSKQIPKMTCIKKNTLSI
jgi:hypothetical protein